MDIWAKLREIDWSVFRTAYGQADKPVFRRGRQIQRPVPDDLEALRSAEIEEAIEAAGNLDSGLCHQHVQLSPAALPALPFVLDVLDGIFDVLNDKADQLTDGLMEILFGMAVITARPAWERERGPAWEQQLFEQLRAELPRFIKLSSHRQASVRETAEGLVELLENPEQGPGFQGG